MTKQNEIRDIVHVAAEAFPFSKSGGLADVTGGLPEEQARQGHRVVVVSPRYTNLRAIPADWTPIALEDAHIEVPFHESWQDKKERHGTTLEAYRSPAGVIHVLVNSPDLVTRDGHAYFDNHTGVDKLYASSDIAKEMAFFCRAAFPAVAKVAKEEFSGFAPKIVHGHDWHAGPVGALLKHGALLPSMFKKSCYVQEVHNVFDNGDLEPRTLGHYLRLPNLGYEYDPANPRGYMHLEYGGRASFLQAGLGNAEKKQGVIAVSQQFANEIKAGYMDRDVRPFADKIIGIANGIDLGQWDPETDPHLPAELHYSAQQPEGKARAKAALLKKPGLVDNCPALEEGKPTICIVGRMDKQKNIDTAVGCIEDLVKQGWNVVFLGSGSPEKNAEVGALKEKLTATYPHNVSMTIDYNEALAHRIFAGSDAILIPSLYEPCGLTQQQGKHYGTVPIAARTGGFVDTIAHLVNGFLFRTESHFKKEPSREDLLFATQEAINIYRDAPAQWKGIMKTGMEEDVSWKDPVAKYDEVYKELAARAIEPARS